MRLLANTTSPYVRLVRMALIEKGLDVPVTIVDPWDETTELRTSNPAGRVPALITDDGTPLTESLLILSWLEAERPPPAFPSLFGPDCAPVLSRAGLAMGVLDAAVHTMITRKVTAPVLFDETPVGLKRRRTMIEGMARLEVAMEGRRCDPDVAPTLDALATVVAYDYLQFRFKDLTWLPQMPIAGRLATTLASRPSCALSVPE